MIDRYLVPLLRIARDHDMRVVGPNCLGVVNTDPDVRLSAWFGADPVPAGSLGVGTQSGAVGIAVARHARTHGTGIAELVSLGNKMDVSGNDLLLRWWHDDRHHRDDAARPDHRPDHRPGGRLRQRDRPGRQRVGELCHRRGRDAPGWWDDQSPRRNDSG